MRTIPAPERGSKSPARHAAERRVRQVISKAEDLGDRRLQARMGVGDAELYADEPTGHQVAQELAPERLGLGLADV